MSVFLLPQFIADLQKFRRADFTRRVLQKTLCADGSFRSDRNDHPYHGIEKAWIRYISRGHTAYRVIYLHIDNNVYLFRAGEHAVEDRLMAPNQKSIATAVPVTKAPSEIESTIKTIPDSVVEAVPVPIANRLRGNFPKPQIYREIFSRRNLPHRDIWLVAPFINTDILMPTAEFGRLLFAQIEDGASVSIFTSPPKDKDISWMERLAEQGINIFIYPRLHTKLYCFVLDENRRYDRGLPNPDTLSSLILIGSANLTKAGFVLGTNHCNEELCYSVPINEIEYVETYVAKLMIQAYDLPQVRAYLARGQWQKLENRKWR